MSALPSDEDAATSDDARVLSGGRGWADAAPTRSSDQEFQFAPPQLVEVMCECDHFDCTGNIVMSLREYKAVRGQAGHEVADVVRVVGYGAGYVVVAKFESAA